MSACRRRWWTCCARCRRSTGLAYLFISHDLRVVRAMAHRIIVLKDGRVVEEGAAARVVEAPQEAYTRALMAAAFDLRAEAAPGLRT